MKVIDNKETNLKKAETLIDTIGKKVDLIVLPEMFNCPYENPKFIEYAEKENKSPTLERIILKAKEYKIFIVAGSIPEKEGDKIYNTSYIINPTGEVLGKHRKLHLFDIDVKDEIYFKESDTLSPGDKISTFLLDDCKIGVGICYDMRFIEQSRLMALNGADILIYPGAFNQTTGPAHWELLIRSISLNNQVFTVACSPALNIDASYHAYGHSMVVDPWGEILESIDENEGVIVCDIDLNRVKSVRQQIPVLLNRRDDIYHLK